MIKYKKFMIKDKKIKHCLTQYGVLMAAIGGINDVSAAIIYTDETPDFAGGSNSQYLLDVNNDGTDDFNINNTGVSLYISPLLSINEVLGSPGNQSIYAYPFALNGTDPISSGQASWFNNGFSSGYNSLNYEGGVYGNFINVTDKYVGLRFDIGGSIHYGWVRLDVNQAGDAWVVKDYAYNDVAGLPINAGEGAPPISAEVVSGITGTDIDETTSGTDLQVSF
ncbi:MAG: hypothetical protein HRT57_03190, partial [Crocinitomicaceae bacterium]|nr:hypothetical protein [Crocinitomicaceae bacterium]